MWIELIILLTRERLCRRLADLTLLMIRQHLIAAEGEKFVDTGGKLCHCKSIFTLNEIFNVIKVTADGSFQLADFFFLQIVFGNGYI